MANLGETPQWESGVYQLETTDEVMAGPDGIDNLQAKQLANRTSYLKQQLEQKTGAASEDVAGIVEIATQAETDTGTDDSRAVSPKKLKNWLKQASESVRGMLRIGTQAQVDTGDDDTVAVTPKKLRYGFAVSFTQNGYIALPTWLGGFIIQWGITAGVPSGSSVGVTFPIAFPNSVFRILATARSATVSSSLSGAINAETVNGFTLGSYSGVGLTRSYDWIAIGY